MFGLTGDKAGQKPGTFVHVSTCKKRLAFFSPEARPSEQPQVAFSSTPPFESCRSIEKTVIFSQKSRVSRLTAFFRWLLC